MQKIGKKILMKVIYLGKILMTKDLILSPKNEKFLTLKGASKAQTLL